MNPDTPPAPDTPTDMPPAVPSAATAEDCAERLRALFPALFTGAPRPLKLRIQADIRERAPGVFSKAVLSAFLHRHTTRTAYLIALTRSAQRFDLDGAAAGEVSAEHRQAATDELAHRRGVREAREAQVAQQRRERAALLRAFESTTLTKPNFCALKGLSVEQLDAQLELARQEAAEARQAPPPRQPPQRRPPPRGPRR